jgi:putative hydrolase of the HAD superfamily
MIDAVVFDFGGVFIGSPFDGLRRLGDERGIDHEQMLAIVFGSYDLDTDHPWHRAERGELDIMTVRDEIRVLGEAEGLDLDLFDMLSALSGGGGVNEEMVALVRRVREKGLRTALLTNNIAEGREFWQGLLPIDELFDVAVDSSAVGMRKPDPRIYQHTLAEIGGVAPERTVFLDDFAGTITAAAIARVDELLAAV